MRSLFLILFLIIPSISHAQYVDPMLNVMDFGAIPNDDIDDTDAFQRAIEVAADSKFQYILSSYYYGIKTIYVPSGIYLVKGIVVNKSYVKLKGDGFQATVIKMNGGAGPVLHLKGASYVEVDNLALDGAQTAGYGIYAEDIGQQLDKDGNLADYAAVHGLLTNVQIRNARGNPGIGFANSDRAHSWKFVNSEFRENNVGIKLIKRAQHSQIIQSSVFANYNQQVILGDGSNYLRDITIRDSNIEGRSIGTTELIRLDGVTPLNLDSAYFEGHRNVNAMDIQTVNLPSVVNITGVYSNGGATTPPLRNILLRTETALTIEGANYINTQKVVEIGSPYPATAKPQNSTVYVKNSRGPGLKRGIELKQGGQSWDDGISLTNGKNSWDIVVGSDGNLYFGANKKTRFLFTTAGEIKSYK